jgi:hypothetical protein
MAGHGEGDNGALFRPIKNNRTMILEQALTPDALYKLVQTYSALLGFEIGAHARNRRHQRARSPGPHCHGAGMARPRQYRHDPHLRSLKTRPEDSSTFKVAY